MSAGLGVSETNCNECRRRKGKCDRALPECTSCSRNRRHCLYEKAEGRTPLTRKNLTEAEEKLRRAEMRARVAERRAIAAEERLAALMHLSETHNTSVPEVSLQSLGSADRIVIGGTGTSVNPNILEPQLLDDDRHLDDGYHGIPEEPPSEGDDFSWDEISRVNRSDAIDVSKQHETPTDDRNEDVVDGMASLTVEERGAGYLGTSSGAAMLRLLMPDAEPRNPARPRRKTTTEDSIQDDKSLAYEELGLTEIDLDSAINAYFGSYHVQYPMIHEPTFRAQYAQIIPRPNGLAFEALVYMLGAIGLFSTATTADAKSNDDLKLFEAAKLNIKIDVLEKGNITLLEVLALMSNYLQKRGKPNSGYNYLGLALHMAMGLGLHKEFANWKLPPLAIENRRRIWWTLYNLFTGALVTFGRPWSWPDKGIETSLPLNIHDRDLTNITQSWPENRQTITTYTFMLAQAKFHQATAEVYTRVISIPYPAASELLSLDDEHLGSWLRNLGPWYSADARVPSKFTLGHHIMHNRARNFRIIMYRPFVIRSVLSAARGMDGLGPSPAEQTAIDRCLDEAKATISSIRTYWSSLDHGRLAAWYSLYFIFQASLIPCLCLRNQPNAILASDWRSQIQQTLSVMTEMNSVNPSSIECQSVIMRLCGQFLSPITSASISGFAPLAATEESPQTQINNVYSMMWPNASPASTDLLMSDSQWGFMTDPGHVGLESLPSNWDWT
ncbi:hypothetical protein E4T42_07401 [Aureobasidium subglaciale]|nr:hypothetical protein E4T42_07401 [Aureobasidium subglaciale]